jgi:hypothetical protein
MSSLIPLKRGFVAALAVAFAFALIPVAAQAAPVNLATASPFVVLGGTTVTNTGPSVLNGDLGVAPGTALPGFPNATVNGATHANDAVAKQAQSDLTNAYNVAAGQPVAPANDLSGTDLGNRTLTAGAYRYTSGALLTGALTLNAAGDPNAQFVFEIGSALTTESASSVVLINGASPCNVYWQVGSSATLGTTTAFQGNLMALTSISLKNAATVHGRMLARNGQVSLINNVLTRPLCAAGSGAPSTPASPGSSKPGSGSKNGGKGNSPGGTNNGGKGKTPAGPNKRPPRGSAVGHPVPRPVCTEGFRATVSGHRIERVSYRLDGRPIGTRTRSPFGVSIPATPGAHRVSARVTFNDATHAKTMKFHYRACASAVLHPHNGPSVFTG